jgi:hypothetical protein
VVCSERKKGARRKKQRRGGGFFKPSAAGAVAKGGRQRWTPRDEWGGGPMHGWDSSEQHCQRWQRALTVEAG